LNESFSEVNPGFTGVAVTTVDHEGPLYGKRLRWLKFCSVPSADSQGWKLDAIKLTFATASIVDIAVGEAT